MNKRHTAGDRELFDSYLSLLQEMIRNQCVNTGEANSGNEQRSVDTLLRFFAYRGLKGEIFTPREGRSSLLVSIPGSDPNAPELMLMGHLDVVPADSDKWSHGPFSAEVAEGRLWGRGTLDMLGQTAAMAAVLGDIYESGEKFPGTIKYLAIADEEAAGTWGARYLVENHWEKVKADYMITELGGFFLDLPGKPKACFTVGEKGVTQILLSATGQASHGSLPYGAENAALKLAEGMIRLAENPPPPRTDGLFAEVVSKLDLPGELETKLLDPSRIDSGLDELSAASPGTARILHACSRMTLSPNFIRAGSKVNIIAGSGHMELDIRTIPGQDEEYWREHLSKVLGLLDEEFRMEVIESFPSADSVRNTPLMDACAECVRMEDRELELIPMLTTVATDGRFWRERGTVVYGFSHYSSELTVDRAFSMIHGPDESVSLESLRRQLEFYRRLPGEFFKSSLIKK